MNEGEKSDCFGKLCIATCYGTGLSPFPMAGTALLLALPPKALLAVRQPSLVLHHASLDLSSSSLFPWNGKME